MNRPAEPDTASGLSLEQSFARIEVTERAVARIWLGLRTVELIFDEARTLADHGNRDLPLETVALGLEHFMKVVLVLGIRQHTGQMPDIAKLKAWRHDLRRLDRDVVTFANDIRYGHDRPALRDDLRFLTSDPIKDALVHVMATITDTGRYDALNELVGSDRSSHPYAHLDALEQVLLERHQHVRELPSQGLFEVLARIHRDETVATCLRWARALARVFTLGYCGPLGQQLKPTVGIFLNLRDDQLDCMPAWR